MKLGTGSINFRIKFVYEIINRISVKNVYADTEEAVKLFCEEYKDCKNIKYLCKGVDKND